MISDTLAVLVPLAAVGAGEWVILEIASTSDSVVGTGAFIKGQAIGYGSFEKVSLAKTISKNSCLQSVVAVKSRGVSHMASLVKECMVYEELKDCREIVTCYGDSYTVEKGEKIYNVVLKYACGRSLADKGLKLVECDVRKYDCSILKGFVKFIHNKGYFTLPFPDYVLPKLRIDH
nr:mitogen-activated protein kinase kinase kinase 17-like [Tanacetum cinerariifolium]